MTMLARIRSVASRGELVKLSQKALTPFECHDVRDVAHTVRGTLRDHEHWSPLVWVNNRYMVQLSHVETSLGQVHHLWIRHHAGVMPRSWSDMQTIKNAVVGKDRVGVEVFPPDDELVDQANLAHLWVYPVGFVMPFRLG